MCFFGLWRGGGGDSGSVVVACGMDLYPQVFRFTAEDVQSLTITVDTRCGPEPIVISRVTLLMADNKWVTIGL